ncbi:hypothetical protein C1645_824979 [Glomus cerebriforme]|uniref:MIR domain-containing protein n=1 Tax=Glomus cerebriforme TaxID=658196 RepID=A0A397T2H1_9GLOM|nr:hypothetical protein C1645_824979 [Glomus cerebriforme]
MEFPKYNATCYPNEYIKQMTAHCKINKITNEQEILEFCKLIIDSTITFPNEINSLDELVMALKLHLTFNIFKNTYKKKLKFLNDVAFDELNVIEYDSLIVLKHVATGKYLSTCKKDKSIAVYARDKLPNSNTVDYRLYIDDNKSPITGHAEVSINNTSVEKLSRLFKDDYAIRFIKSNSTHNNDYVKTKDIIKLQFLQMGCLLRSHDSTFMIGNKPFQEVIGYQERAGGNDKV